MWGAVSSTCQGIVVRPQLLKAAFLPAPPPLIGHHSAGGVKGISLGSLRTASWKWEQSWTKTAWRKTSGRKEWLRTGKDLKSICQKIVVQVCLPRSTTLLRFWKSCLRAAGWSSLELLSVGQPVLSCLCEPAVALFLCGNRGLQSPFH